MTIKDVITTRTVTVRVGFHPEYDAIPANDDEALEAYRERGGPTAEKSAADALRELADYLDANELTLNTIRLSDMAGGSFYEISAEVEERQWASWE